MALSGRLGYLVLVLVTGHVTAMFEIKNLSLDGPDEAGCNAEVTFMSSVDIHYDNIQDFGVYKMVCDLGDSYGNGGRFTVPFVVNKESGVEEKRDEVKFRYFNSNPGIFLIFLEVTVCDNNGVQLAKAQLSGSRQPRVKGTCSDMCMSSVPPGPLSVSVEYVSRVPDLFLVGEMNDFQFDIMITITNPSPTPARLVFRCRVHDYWMEFMSTEFFFDDMIPGNCTTTVIKSIALSPMFDCIGLRCVFASFDVRVRDRLGGVYTEAKQFVFRYGAGGEPRPLSGGD